MSKKIWYQTPSCGRDFKFTRPFRADGSLTKSAMMLNIVYHFSGRFTRRQILRMIGIVNYSSRGQFTNMWNSARNADLIRCGNGGSVVAGNNLEVWYNTYFN